jgi:3'(2'), 5'-bisphosphate nucleotidase
MTQKPDFALLNRWADHLLPVVRDAGKAILDVRARGVTVTSKADASPVTEADHAAEGILLPHLEGFTPAFPIVAEERMAAGLVPTLTRSDFWLVDALDGTKEFINGGDDFTVNVALIFDGVPIFGIVHAPVRKETYLGIAAADGRRADLWRDDQRMPLAVRPRPKRIVITGSKSHEVPEKMDPFLAQYDVAEKKVIGSSLKFCLVASGVADLYPRFGPTCEWDVAAGHAVVRAAGGRVHTFDGVELQYRKPNFLNGAFLADAGP